MLKPPLEGWFRRIFDFARKCFRIGILSTLLNLGLRNLFLFVILCRISIYSFNFSHFSRAWISIFINHWNTCLKSHFTVTIQATKISLRKPRTSCKLWEIMHVRKTKGRRRCKIQRNNFARVYSGWAALCHFPLFLRTHDTLGAPASLFRDSRLLASSVRHPLRAV